MPGSISPGHPRDTAMARALDGPPTAACDATESEATSNFSGASQPVHEQAVQAYDYDRIKEHTCPNRYDLGDS